MSLRRNILANVVSQLYVTLIGIVMVPLYIKYMGAEAYGLVGFFAMLQAWFSLLDIGLTPTIARETARCRGGALSASDYRRLLRTLEWLFLAVAVGGTISVMTGSRYIAEDWLRPGALAVSDVQAAVQMMGAVIGMRWMSGLYRGAIGGAERIEWLSGFNAFVATLRSGGVLPLIAFVSAEPVVFFGYQVVISAIELGWLLAFAYRTLPAASTSGDDSWDWAVLQPILRFSLAIAFTSSVWVLVTQTDKLLLSRILPLAEYGYFTLAVLVAGGILIISGPVSNAVMPRLARLEAQGQQAELVVVYRQATQLVTVVASAMALTLAFFAAPLFSAWTGNAVLAERAAPVLSLYSIGNGVMAVSAFPYYLQYAKGNLRLHLIGNGAFVVLLLPAIVWAASEHGAVGAGWAWLGMNLLAFVAWLPLVHRKFVPGLNRSWYFEDVLIIAAVAALTAWLLSFLLPVTSLRGTRLAEIVFAGVVIMLSAAAASSTARAKLQAWREHAP